MLAPNDKELSFLHAIIENVVLRKNPLQIFDIKTVR